MKKFFRVMLLVTLILAIFGGVLLGAGILAGANAEDFERNSRKSTFWSHVFRTDRLEDAMDRWSGQMENWGEDFGSSMENWADGLEEGMDDWGDHLDSSIENWADGLDSDMEQWAQELEANIEGWASGLYASDWDYKDSREVTKEVTFPAEKLSQLSLKLDSGKAEILVSQDEEIRIEGMYPYDKAEYKEGSGKLEILRDGSGEETEQEVLKIQIPQKQLESVELKCDSGILRMDQEISAQEWKITADSSILTTQFGDCQKVKIVSDSSKITAAFPKSQEDYKIDIKSDSGIVRVGEESYMGETQKGTFGNLTADREMDIKADSSILEMQFHS